ncbi:hypothetical protein [Aneurinibacillus aneurinilyticus]|uniref:hypothetical protein n=1 Tax=Aneurinibacillus aneurinilyticus TaxID=1391 RepID=UPI0023FA142A|nr:hypothetical protein [Aneurinibacillus aneurinilyticus]MCI1695584.1 hypothetical protein [Aneurinibacillus aneurinilyticus]
MGFKDAVIAILSLADPDMLRENSRSWQIDGKQYAKRDAGPNMRMKMTCGYGEIFHGAKTTVFTAFSYYNAASKNGMGRMCEKPSGAR